MTREWAERDLDDLMDADLLILDTLDDDDRGGREVELGYCIDTNDTWIVGPKRNIFHSMVDRQFDTWDEAINAIAN